MDDQEPLGILAAHLQAQPAAPTSRLDVRCEDSRVEDRFSIHRCNYVSDLDSGVGSGHVPVYLENQQSRLSGHLQKIRKLGCQLNRFDADFRERDIGLPA